MRNRLTLAVVLIGALLPACYTSERIGSAVNYSRYKGEIEYSNYFEDTHELNDGSLKIYLLITLGTERLPGEKPAQTKWGRANYAQGEIEEVYEVYFTNEGDASVQLELMTLNDMDLNPDAAVLKPGGVLKTTPVVRIASIHKKEAGYELIIKLGGEQVVIERIAKRLTADELVKRAR